MHRKVVSVIGSALILTGMLFFASSIRTIKAHGSIYTELAYTGPVYILTNGTVTPSTAPIQRNGNYYTLTGNITSSTDGIIIQKSNITIDGAGYILMGNGSGNGISLNQIANVTVRNTQIKGFYDGVLLQTSSNNVISGNNITENKYIGMRLVLSSLNNVISGNNLTANNYDGMDLTSSSNNNIIFGNDALANNATGIILYYSNDNLLFGNKLATNKNDGFVLSYSLNNTVFGNNITANNNDGIGLLSSTGNRMYHNNFQSNYHQAEFGNIGGSDIWDDGYPSGGNYWSDYLTKYPSAAENDSSGIWNTPYVIVPNNIDRFPLMAPAPALWPAGGVVGITGYKLVFKETMNNLRSSAAAIDYYWSFSADEWDGAKWVAAAISGSSTPVNGYVIPAQTTVDLPYYVYLLPMSGSNAVTWGEWLRINYTFHSTYSGVGYSTSYTAKLHVHPGDIAGAASVAFPYLGADGVIGAKDLHVVGLEWGLSSVGADPTSNLARADINGDGVVGAKDLHILGTEWSQTWTNIPST